VTPPIQPYLLSFIYRTDQQSNLERKQLHVSKGDPDVPGYNQTLVEDPIQDIDQSGRA
jgi:hypothetical protein